MPKYGQFKYGQAKYGRYDLEIQGEILLGDLTYYRLRTISNNEESRAITNYQLKLIGTGGPVKIRLRTNEGEWVVQENAQIKGDPLKIRIKAVTKNEESQWLESAKATIRKKE